LIPWIWSCEPPDVGFWEPHSKHSITHELSFRFLFYFLNGYWKKQFTFVAYFMLLLDNIDLCCTYDFLPNEGETDWNSCFEARDMTAFCLLSASQYSDEFVQSAYLSRRLAYFCARRLSLLLSDSPNLLAAHSPHMIIGTNNTSIGTPSPGTPGPGMSPVQLAFSDFLSCAQHGPLVYGLSCMLQVSPQWSVLFYVKFHCGEDLVT
jgi:hypothetical protein